MNSNAPLVSIGIPVRNGQNYLRAALDSILAQTMDDFEVVICDNASTDSTAAICQEYARRDARVHYFLNERDLGPAENHNRCVANSRGTFFRWQAHDDLLHPQYLERVVRVLQNDPRVSNAHCWTHQIHGDGSHYGNYIFPIGTESPSVVTRFRRLINVRHRRHLEYEIFGLWRREQMIQTRLQGSFAHGDRVHLVRMSLYGRFVEVPEFLFSAREHPNQSLQQTTRRSRYLHFLGTGPIPPAEWWNKELLGKVTFPEWNLLYEYWRMLRDAKMSTRERAWCRFHVVVWAFRNAAKLFRDVAFAAEQTLLKLLHLRAGADKAATSARAASESTNVATRAGQRVA